jgi:Inner membrane protein YgaP-like, transmembrane domain
MKLQLNESRTDRLVRIVVGGALAALAMTGVVTAPLVYVVWVVAAIAIGTGVVGFCAIYALLGVSTKHEVPTSR